MHELESPPPPHPYSNERGSGILDTNTSLDQVTRVHTNLSASLLLLLKRKHKADSLTEPYDDEEE